MTARKTLTSIVLARALEVDSTKGNKDQSQYKDEDKIGDDQVTVMKNIIFLN